MRETNRTSARCHLLGAVLFALYLCDVSSAQICGDADASGDVTVLDGIRVLRAAAELPEEGCALMVCDVDRSDTITVADGVNVLRAAADLAGTLDCNIDPVINAVNDERGQFGELTKIPGGLQSSASAQRTIQDVDFKSFVPGRLNTIVVTYDVRNALPAGSGDLSLAIASTVTGEVPNGAFVIPVDGQQGAVSLALNIREDLAIQEFDLRIANSLGTSPVGEVREVNLFIINNSEGLCGDLVVDNDENCEPPQSSCTDEGRPGSCNDSCLCIALPGPTPTPSQGDRFIVDEKKETVLDTTTNLQWERKTSVPGSGQNFADPHDVDNRYTWRSSQTGDPGTLFTEFLAVLNTTPCFAGHCDWCLPTVGRDGLVPELETIVDENAAGCGDGAPCIDPAFGPTFAGNYWSVAVEDNASQAYIVDFRTGFIRSTFMVNLTRVRAVRGDAHMCEGVSTPSNR